MLDKAFTKYPVSDKKQLPCDCGVYVVTDTNKSVLYVGSAVNIQKRWTRHHRSKDVINAGAETIYCLILATEQEAREQEKILIKQLSPKLNGTKVKARVDVKRLTIALIGEFYTDLLLVESWLCGRSFGLVGSSLICEVLEKEDQKIRERVAYLAKKRGISSDELWTQILSGSAQPMDAGTESDEDDG